MVMAGGDGRRLHSLTMTPGGVAVPKQYCSLRDGPSLLQKTLQCALQFAPLHQVCAVVVAQHRMWHNAQLRHLCEANVIEQPENRGTANGVLFALLHVVVRDPDATILLLPADHHVVNEHVFNDAVRNAMNYIAGHPRHICLLGVEPDEPDTELGYIVPERRDGDGPAGIVEFVEKPDLVQAQLLLERGALWSTFTLAASARALLSLFSKHFEPTIKRLRNAIKETGGAGTDATYVTDMYRTLPTRDFSRDVLEGQEARLHVLPIPSCGWTDLGTPERVARALHRLPHSTAATGRISDAALGLDLAAQQWRLQFPGPLASMQT
ncbi:MAG: mannose-phosphate guanylyltransferase [Gammaproteobacteria bacterium]|nr:mannose-phosphate guanylyltransferase [Gammaproteobacteria bacterium]